MEAHLYTIQTAFPLASVVGNDGFSISIHVEDIVNGYQLALLVEVDNNFPLHPPRFTLPYSQVMIPVHVSSMPSTSTASEPFIRWDPQHPDLVEATRQGFRVSFLYWGKVVPPVVQILEGALAAENPAVLQMLVSNPNRLDLYVHNHPMSSALKSASHGTLEEIKALLEENRKLGESLVQQQKQVLLLQSQLESRVKEVDGLQKNAEFVSLCTPERVIQTMQNRIRQLEESSRPLSRSVLDTPAGNKRAFEEALEAFRSNARDLHLVKIKLNEFAKMQKAASH